MNPVGVIGLGVVGGTVADALELAGVSVRRYDGPLGVGRPADLAPCQVVFLCVPTPGSPEGYRLEAVWSAAAVVEPHLGPEAVLAVKSTVPPGTTERLARAFPRIEVASVPEFLVAGRPLESFTRPDRIVIGARSSRAAAAVAEILARVAPAAPVLVLTPTEAELVKLASNAMLAARVALANELFEVCRRHGVDWSRVQAGVGLDRRIGPDHLTVTPERGFGGACLPKDLDGLIAASRAAGYRPRVLEEIAAFNRRVREEAARSGAPGEAVGSRARAGRAPVGAGA